MSLPEKDRHILSLVIPCYNEEASLASCVGRCLELENGDLGLELIIVDDCSTDNSLAVAEKLAREHPQITVMHHEVNQGKGAALRTGFTVASGDFVGIQDADMEYNPRDYLPMLELIKQDKADVVFGSRYLKAETRRVLYFWHTWMNRTLTAFSNMLTNLDITDMETCYKLFKREVIHAIAPTLKENRFGCEPELTTRVAQMRCRVYEHAIAYQPRSYEEGKKINWKDGVRALYCILHYGGPTAPLPMQLILYFFIGSICAVANLASFALLFNLTGNINASVVSAFILSAGLNYILCVFFLFRHKARWSSTGELVTYILTVCIMGILDYGMTIGLVALSVTPYWSKVWATIFGFIGNFLFRKYFVFYERGILTTK